MYKYKTSGVCSKDVSFDIIDGIVRNISFSNGCEGNLKGISILAEGMKVGDLVSKLENVKCENKTTSCPAQLAIALKNHL